MLGTLAKHLEFVMLVRFNGCCQIPAKDVGYMFSLKLFFNGNHRFNEQLQEFLPFELLFGVGAIVAHIAGRLGVFLTEVVK